MSDDIWCLKGELSFDEITILESGLEALAEEEGIFPPTLSYFEQGPDAPWQVEIFFPTAPEPDFITALLERTNLADWPTSFDAVEEKDWVSESQKLLQPVEAGRFFIFGSHDADKAKEGSINLLIDAGQAFGTGKHETTAACLKALDQMAEEVNPETVLDLGTGSGVLALGAHKLWPDARVVASDIDPIAVDVSRENVDINKGVTREIGASEAGIALVTADGLDAPDFKTENSFDLIIANILAGPLVDMAADITGALAKGGRLLLSGLLVSQEKEVLDAYTARGLTSLGRIEEGEWAALLLQTAY